MDGLFRERIGLLDGFFFFFLVCRPSPHLHTLNFSALYVCECETAALWHQSAGGEPSDVFAQWQEAKASYIREQRAVPASLTVCEREKERH